MRRPGRAADSVAELITKAVREKAQPQGVPWDYLTDAERQRWLDGGQAAVAALWKLGR